MNLRVNADYESELFLNRPGPKIINESIEFLAFFLEEEALLTQKDYPPHYLEYISHLTGVFPRITKSGKALNWWGELKHIEKERWLNSKITSTDFILAEGFCSETKLLTDLSQFEQLVFDREFLIKTPFGMSGQGFKNLRTSQDLPALKDWILKNLELSPLILEPKFDRVYDFSHFIPKDGLSLSYQNIVDDKFQHKGTLFQDHLHPGIETLSFYAEIPQSEWTSFSDQLLKIQNHFNYPASLTGFSIDSFVYREQGKLKIRALSEINHRRTMGKVTWNLAQKFGLERPWATMLMGKPMQAAGGFNYLQQKLKDLLLEDDCESGVIILSPGDTRFEILFLTAADAASGKDLISKINQLLPDAQFTVHI